MAESRKTSISWVESEKITVRGYRIEDLIGGMTFGSSIFLILTGRIPNPEEAKLFEAILVAVIDHGTKPPSTIAAVTVANTGSGLNSAVAAGILSINKYHGGAIEDSMIAIRRANDISVDEGCNEIAAANGLVADFKRNGKRVSGFGHRFHGSDPRTERLFALAGELGLSGKFVLHAKAIELALSESAGRTLPINADGAIAALLCELGFPPKAANGIFMIARVPGLVAHVIEEQERNPPMRTIEPDNYEYDGPEERKL